MRKLAKRDEYKKRCEASEVRQTSKNPEAWKEVSETKRYEENVMFSRTRRPGRHRGERNMENVIR